VRVENRYYFLGWIMYQIYLLRNLRFIDKKNLITGIFNLDIMCFV